MLFRATHCHRFGPVSFRDPAWLHDRLKIVNSHIGIGYTDAAPGHASWLRKLLSAKAFSSDCFDDALDYTAVVKRLQVLASEHTHKLLERFAEAIADILCREFGAPWASVRVVKLAPLAGVKQIGVAIERGKRN